jgi:L-lysine exporter family protein LysE/ArgO
MLSPILTGFMLCFSLNCVVGAQNTYLFRQGMRNEYVYTLAIFCILSDLLLITIGVYGMSLIVNQFYIDVFLLLSAACLFGYGFIRIKNIVGLSYNLNEKVYMQKNLRKSMLTMIAFTLLNPHVYLDTIILIGSASLQYNDNEKLYYILGATFASVIFFYGVAAISKLFSSFSKNIILLKIIDFIMGIILFIIAIMMLKASSFI